MCSIYDAVQAAANLVVAAVEIKEIQTQKAESEYQTEFLTKQAKKAEKDAAYVRQEGIEEARRKRLQSILNMGEEKTNLAAGNIGLSSQMAINIVDDEKLNGELDALTTLKDSEREAQKYMDRAEQYYAQAGLTSFRSKNRYSSGLMTSASGILSQGSMYLKSFSKSK